MDMRSKAYPPLPEGRGLHLVLPRDGDLRFRPQVPSAFAQRLYIHADPRRRFWYASFQLTRQFIVMSTQGDLYAKNSVAALTMADLPKGNVLNMPRVAQGDLVKVLDLVQCSRSEGQRWELVFTRWRNGMETWLPLEVVLRFAPDLMQEFYVNSINSWAFHSRVQPGKLAAFRTEVELWLFHSEFQEFYKKLRQKRGASVQQQDQVRVKPETGVSANTSRIVPRAGQPPAPVAAARRDPSEDVLQQFEQRRLALERQQQLDRMRLDQIVQRQQQQRAGPTVGEQIRLDREREERVRRDQERQELERRSQHERQRQQAHEELQRRQKEYQQRLRLQQAREERAELQKRERERLQRAQEQEKMRKRLQQEKSLQERAARKQAASSRAATRTLLRHRERHQNNGSPKSQLEQDSASSSIWTKKGDGEYVPLEDSESEDSDVSSDSEASEDSLPIERTRTRRRKRLLYSQVKADDDEDDDDLPDLSQPPPTTRQRNIEEDNSEDEAPARKSRKRRKRLHQSSPTKETGGTSNVEVDLMQLSDDEEEDSALEIPTAAPKNAVKNEGGQDSGGVSEVSPGLVDDDNCVDVDADADADDGMDFEQSMIIGEIRCTCGASSVGGYRGQWLQCWKEDCGVWEHADCVGFLTNFESHPPPKYLCTRCDPETYLTRCVKASQRILDWLFQCCDSRNLKQLMDLLEDKTGETNLPADWKNENYENMTLAMQVARNGLVKCLRYLLDDRKVDIFATDRKSRNALHHAALGGSAMCCRVLLKRDRKLLLHQDLRGCMPFHCMLQSAKVNLLCIPFIREDPALVGMADLDSNFPIHYACQAINGYSVKICQMIFAAQPSMLEEKSSEGLYPLMILFKAASGAATNRNTVSGEVTKSAEDIVALALDIDVFGDCLNQKAPNGWSALHFAAASGNHELVTHLCNIGIFDVHQVVMKTGQTALHIAAQENHPLCVRALLLEELDVIAKDSNGWIPMLYAVDVACIQEFMHHKLTKQLSRLHRMLSKYQQRGLVRRWLRWVAQDPTCFDILNDWCQSDTERIERMEGLLLSNPLLLRLDNRIEYVWTYIIPSIKKTHGQTSIAVGNGEPGSNQQPGTKTQKLAFVFLRASGCFWKQFVGMSKLLEPEDFRFPTVFSIERAGANSQAENRESNLKLVLIRLAAGLLKEVPGLLVRGSNGDLAKKPFASDKEEALTHLLEFFLLGELVAHFVLYAVSLSGILDFAPEFLRCIGCKGKYKMVGDEPWENAGRSFTAGFEAVLPATLELFHGDALRVLFNGPEARPNALQIDWSTAVDWKIGAPEAMGGNEIESAKVWLPRLISELVEEEQQLLLLFMTGTYQLVNERFFRLEGEHDRVTIASYPETDNVLDHDILYPMMEHKQDVLHLPSYSSYGAFKKAMLTVIRHADQAFPSE